MPRPQRAPLQGDRVRLEPLNVSHAPSLFAAAHGQSADPHLWDFLPYGPFGDEPEFAAWVQANAPGDDPLFLAIVDRDGGAALGVASYLRITPGDGAIEIGHIWFGADLQRTALATEAIFLLARHVFELGYRRLEWKCDARNERSRRAAERFGFRFEGIFRQHMVVKGRNRDSAWYSLLDREWPTARRAFESWLDPANFDAAGRQLSTLSEMRELSAQTRCR